MKKGPDWAKGRFYLDPAISDPAALRRKVMRRKASPFLYLVTLSCTEGNMLELIPACFLNQSYLRNRCPLIVGMAKGKSAAISLVEQILSEALAETGDCRVDAVWFQ
ncbi:MAG: hypothetical protein IKE58_10920 [Blautia sp.]|nr:hypothetical protein [Blautia sp.]